MGKKNRHSAKTLPAEPAGVSVEQQAQEELAARRFRKARDLFKLLCKEDRAKYLPGLVAANRGLAEDLMAKGQVSEAEQVIAYLKTITPPGKLLSMDLMAAQRAQDWPRALRLAAECWTAAHGELPPRDRTTVGDTLVLAFPDLAAAPATHVPEALRADLAGILDALRALSEERFADAQDALRPIPRGSLFADWKMFVKGWLALHSGDRAKAAQFLDAVPPDSVPGRAAGALRPFLALVQAGVARPSDATLAHTCQLAGEPALGPILARADALWRAGQHFASWSEMRRAHGFPSEQPGLPGALSDFYFRVYATLREDDTGRYVVEGLFKFAEKGQFKSPAERRLVCRTLGSDALANGEPMAAEDWWGEFIDACPADDPRTSRMAGLIFAHLGHWMAQPPGLDSLAHGVADGGLRDPEGALSNLEESIVHDPEALAPYLDLLKVFAHERLPAERKNLLDAALRRFPNEKAVLFEAGRDQLEREAFAEGLALLERAHAIDRLDPQTMCELVRAHFLLARWQYEKKNLAAARETLARVEQYAVRDGLDFDRGLDLLRARRAGMELAFGDEAVSRELLAAARRGTRASAAVVLLAHVVYRANASAPPSQGLFWKELKGMAAETAAERALLVHVLDHGPKLNEALSWKAEATFVRDSLAPVTGAAFTRDEAMELHARVQGKPGFDKFVKDLLKVALQRDRNDPRFLILKELSIKRRNGWIDLNRIAFLRGEAVRRGDQKAVIMADAVLNRPLPMPPGFDVDDLDEDFGDTFDGGSSADSRAIPGQPAGPIDLAASFGLNPGNVADLKRMADQMSDHEFAKFRKKSAKILPMALFDLLIGTRAPAPKPKGRTTSQLDLF